MQKKQHNHNQFLDCIYYISYNPDTTEQTPKHPVAQDVKPAA